MRPRYLVAIAELPSQLGSIKACMQSSGEAHVVFEHGPVLVLAVGRQFQQLQRRGILIGTLFTRGSSGPAKLDKAAEALALSTRGMSLIDGCWGGYVAVIADAEAGRVDVVRAPLGDLACYWTRFDGMVLIASDLALMRAAGMAAPAVNHQALALHLAAEDLRRSETCLIGINELQGGERMTVCRGTIDRDVLWSPWNRAADERQIADPNEAARRVRDAALHCVRARAGSLGGPILLKLSGGLDSSIVAACLKASQRPFSCLTLATSDPAGDERDHAGLVARTLGVPLMARYRDESKVNVEQSAAARLPRPTARAFVQETSRIAAEVASAAGCTAIFDGGGGDNVFCSLQSARPAADALMSEAGEGWFRQTATAIAQLAQASIWTVARRAWLMTWRRSPAYRWELDMRFLAPQVAKHIGEQTPHPWLVAPKGVLPGKAAHVALIAAAQSVVEGPDAEDPLPTYSPLISQPLVEACLQVPSWLWFEAGRNRAIARRAFQTHLPAATINRRSKGAPDCFIADLYDANRPVIRGMLLDGVLSGHGLLDTDALLEALNDDAPVRGHDFIRIMQLVDAEAWARCWS